MSKYLSVDIPIPINFLIDIYIFLNLDIYVDNWIYILARYALRIVFQDDNYCFYSVNYTLNRLAPIEYKGYLRSLFMYFISSSFQLLF